MFVPGRRHLEFMLFRREREKERKREREKERKREREKERKREKEKERERERARERSTDTDRHRQTQIQTQTQRQSQTERSRDRDRKIDRDKRHGIETERQILEDKFSAGFVLDLPRTHACFPLFRSRDVCRPLLVNATSKSSTTSSRPKY